jgi:hypothetical protein
VPGDGHQGIGHSGVGISAIGFRIPRLCPYRLNLANWPTIQRIN